MNFVHCSIFFTSRILLYSINKTSDLAQKYHLKQILTKKKISIKSFVFYFLIKSLAIMFALLLRIFRFLARFNRRNRKECNKAAKVIEKLEMTEFKQELNKSIQSMTNTSHIEKSRKMVETLKMLETSGKERSFLLKDSSKRSVFKLELSSHESKSLNQSSISSDFSSILTHHHQQSQEQNVATNLQLSLDDDDLSDFEQEKIIDTNPNTDNNLSSTTSTLTITKKENNDKLNYNAQCSSSSMLEQEIEVDSSFDIVSYDDIATTNNAEKIASECNLYQNTTNDKSVSRSTSSSPSSLSLRKRLKSFFKRLVSNKKSNTNKDNERKEIQIATTLSQPNNQSSICQFIVKQPSQSSKIAHHSRTKKNHKSNNKNNHSTNNIDFIAYLQTCVRRKQVSVRLIFYILYHMKILIIIIIILKYSSSVANFLTYFNSKLLCMKKENNRFNNCELVFPSRFSYFNFISRLLIQDKYKSDSFRMKNHNHNKNTERFFFNSHRLSCKITGLKVINQLTKSKNTNTHFDRFLIEYFFLTTKYLIPTKSFSKSF